MKKKLLTTLALITLSATLTGCAEVKSPDSQKTIQDITPASETEDTAEITSTSENAEAESDLPEFARVGQIVSGDKWSIALLYAKEYDSIESEYYSDKPSDGNKFLVLFFDVKNISPNNDYFNSMYFEGYADDYSANSSIIMGNPDGLTAIGGNIDAGKMAKGTIVYEVPADWKTFEISYKDGLWTTHKAATFIINKEDISPSDYICSDSVFDEYVFDVSKKTESGAEVGNDKWNVKLIDAKKYDTIGDSLPQKPDEGKQFVVFFIEAKNVSSEDDYFNSMYFRFYIDGYLNGQTLLLSDIEGYDSVSGDVASGKMIKGYVATQAPIDWKSVELIYDDGTFVENKVAEFAIVNE